MKVEVYQNIQATIAQIIKDTKWENHVFLVGGCIRDHIMQRKINDIDIAVNLVNGGIEFVKWLEKHRLAARGRSVQIFKHFGTAKVRLRQFPEYVIDCVQTRKDQYIYEEEPCPEKNFGTIEEDAIRRDLTINSLYINISSGELLDPTGMGIHDIESHIIRTPNDPDITLTDNPMHVLRCIRFAVRYGWELSPVIIGDLKRNVGILAQATKKRMLKEAFAITELTRKDKAIELIDQIGATPYVSAALAAAEEMKRLDIPIEPGFHHRKKHHHKKKKAEKARDQKR